MIDLHCHSHFSDGALSPSALVQKALDAGIQLLALTDHDTIDGLTDLHAAAHQQAIRVINGIELSVRWKKYDIHILGLNINAYDEQLNALIKRQNECRITRALQISELMKTCGVVDAYEKACVIAGHRRIGRPHFAQILVDEGKAKDMTTAFKRFLVQGRPAYVPTQWINLEEALTTILNAGGDAVIAHPLKYKLTRSKLYKLITDFKTAGGEAIEVISGDMTKLQINEMLGICMRFNLLASSGSDYHSDTASRIKLGRQQPLPLDCIPLWHKWNEGQ